MINGILKYWRVLEGKEVAGVLGRVTRGMNLSLQAWQNLLEGVTQSSLMSWGEEGRCVARVTGRRPAVWTKTTGLDVKKKRKKKVFFL